MNWLFDLLLTLFEHRRDDRSVVGKSRLDEETARFWRWIALAVLVIGTTVWLLTRA